MKNVLLLLILPLIMLTTVAAQEYHWHRGDTFYYAIRSSQKMGSDHLADMHYIFRIRVVGKADKQYRLQCILLFADMQTSGRGGFHFRSDDLNTLPGNSTGSLPLAAVINKPFEVWIDDRGVEFSTHGLDQLMAASSRLWVLPEHIAHQLHSILVDGFMPCCDRYSLPILNCL